MLVGGHGIVRKTYCDRCGSEMLDDKQTLVWHRNSRDHGFDNEPLHYDLCPNCDALVRDFLANPKPVFK